MDFEATDRDMSSWVVSCVHNGARFYLNAERLATDIPARAATWRWEDEATSAAGFQRNDASWGGRFDWQPMRVAEMMAVRL